MILSDTFHPVDIFYTSKMFVLLFDQSLSVMQPDDISECCTSYACSNGFSIDFMQYLILFAMVQVFFQQFRNYFTVFNLMQTQKGGFNQITFCLSVSSGGFWWWLLKLFVKTTRRSPFFPVFHWIMFPFSKVLYVADVFNIIDSIFL